MVLQDMKSKKVFWLTGSSFFDVDEKLVPEMNKLYDIHWFVLVQKESFYKSSDIRLYMKEKNVNGTIVDWPRLRSFKSLRNFFRLTMQIKNGNYDLIYIDYLGLPYMFPLFYIFGLHKKKIIYACHDFVDHVKIKNRGFIVKYKKFIFDHFPYFQFFSKTQLTQFFYKYSKKAYYAPLALKGFGTAKSFKKDDEKVVFLFFGKIQDRKGLEYLIKAANLVYERCPDRFVVRICGASDEWGKYESLIKHPECFDLLIRRIENSEIPDIFTTADFLVLPYKDVTQSGPLFISYNYKVPVIASNHPGFSEYIHHGETGFLFDNCDETSLANIMIDIIEGMYRRENIRLNLNIFIKNNNSLESIVKKYDNGFKMVMNDDKK